MSISHISLTSTNTRETVDEQYGPSRSLGVFLGYLGNKLEAHVEKLSRGRKTNTSTSQNATASAAYIANDIPENIFTEIPQTISSDGTTSHVAGPGATHRLQADGDFGA